MNPKVTIIIPTYNRAHLIEETLDSILAQTYKNWECLVVDDGSTDNTQTVVDNYIKLDSRFQFHSRPSNRLKGGNAARNYGYELSQGEFINWFDSDDIMSHIKIEEQVSRLIKNNLDFSVCQTLVFENNVQNILGLRSSKINSFQPFQDYLEGNIVWLTQAPLWRKSFLQNFNYLFDEELLVSQEWEFFCRILFDNNKFDVIKKPLVFSRKHLETKSYGNQKIKDEQYIKAREKVYSFIKNQNPSKDSITYFGNYFVSKYKKKLLEKEYNLAFKFLINQLLKFNDFTIIFKIKLIIAFILFVTFNRGEFILKGKKYKKYNG